MNRSDIEQTLNQGRNWLLARYDGLREQELTAPATASEHDPAVMWSAQEHLVHQVLLEEDWNGAIRRHIAGDELVIPLMLDSSGWQRTMNQVFAALHEWTQGWADAHRDDDFEDIVALGQRARASTLTLLSELTQAQIDSTIPGTPWGDGIVGGILAANAEHGRTHWQWVAEGRENMAQAQR